jgi:hypothetical protein
LDFPEPSIRNQQSQAVIFQHPGNIQILNADDTVRSGYLARHLVLVVQPTIGDAPVKPCQLLLGTIPSTTTLLSAG